MEEILGAQWYFYARALLLLVTESKIVSNRYSTKSGFGALSKNQAGVFCKKSLPAYFALCHKNAESKTVFKV